MADLKAVYRAVSKDAAETALDELDARWGSSIQLSSRAGAASGLTCRLISAIFVRNSA